MTPDPAGQTAKHMAPLVAALRDRAAHEAAEVLAAADADVEDIIDRARTEADGLLAQARAKGEADAAQVLAAQRARAHREARTVTLAAQQSAGQEARQAARDAVSALREDPRYPQLLAALRARVEHELGSGATIVELPRGGIRATLGDQHLEFSLDGLADDLLDRGSDLSELWSP